MEKVQAKDRYTLKKDKKVWLHIKSTECFSRLVVARQFLITSYIGTVRITKDDLDHHYKKEISTNKN